MRCPFCDEDALEEQEEGILVCNECGETVETEEYEEEEGDLTSRDTSKDRI